MAKCSATKIPVLFLQSIQSSIKVANLILVVHVHTIGHY